MVVPLRRLPDRTTLPPELQRQPRTADNGQRCGEGLEIPRCARNERGETLNHVATGPCRHDGALNNDGAFGQDGTIERP